MSWLTGRGVSVVAAWALINAVLAALLFIFNARDEVMERAFYFAAVGVLLVAAVALLAVPRRRRPVGRPETSAVVAPAFAAACLLGGLAWVFGVYVAYFALPLMALVVGRLWAESRGHSLR